MYLDPGFGSMIIQWIIAGIAIIGSYLFIIRKKIMGIFSKKGMDTMEMSVPKKRDDND